MGGQVKPPPASYGPVWERYPTWWTSTSSGLWSDWALVGFPLLECRNIEEMLAIIFEFFDRLKDIVEGPMAPFLGKAPR